MRFSTIVWIILLAATACVRAYVENFVSLENIFHFARWIGAVPFDPLSQEAQAIIYSSIFYGIIYGIQICALVVLAVRLFVDWYQKTRRKFADLDLRNQ